ncbi:MAG: type II toxin-antitoxin system RelB/DinJ family antitoxin [Holophagaceae bacterium]|jgi:addiction module RelB/DinJ family antitoxin|nr:type II toxin-antitoxin system RelB/DinJ family antitoxin [Holophagaceae bacterium]
MPVQISASLDEVTNQEFGKICEAIGITPTTAITLFVKTVINHKGIPFNPVIPDQISGKKTMEETIGCMEGKIWMANDFDDPLEEFMDYME